MCKFSYKIFNFFSSNNWNVPTRYLPILRVYYMRRHVFLLYGFNDVSVRQQWVVATERKRKIVVNTTHARNNNNNNIIVAVVGVNRISRVGTGKTIACRAPAVHELYSWRQIAPLATRMLLRFRRRLRGNILLFIVAQITKYNIFIIIIMVSPTQFSAGCRREVYCMYVYLYILIYIHKKVARVNV